MGNPGTGMQQPVQAAVINYSHGHLKIHPVQCNLYHNTGVIMDKIKPFIKMRVSPLKEGWRSSICLNGGSNPRWGVNDHMQVECGLMQHKLYIELSNKKVFGAEVIGHAEVSLDFFKRPNGHFDGVVELSLGGMPAGELIVQATYHPEAITVTAKPYIAQPPMQQQNMGSMGSPRMGMPQLNVARNAQLL